MDYCKKGSHLHHAQRAFLISQVVGTSVYGLKRCLKQKINERHNWLRRIFDKILVFLNCVAKNWHVIILQTLSLSNIEIPGNFLMKFVLNDPHIKKHPSKISHVHKKKKVETLHVYLMMRIVLF